ncbi:MAG: hypothetical protein KAJ23_12270 [Maribacter sp.]|nr:hypothetical protein [Maribacter sp.]
MKNISLTLASLIFIFFTQTIQAQKKKNVINLKKVEYIADIKTEELNKIVHLDDKNQRKNIHRIYSGHEIQKQKLLKNAKKKIKGNHQGNDKTNIDHLEKELNSKVVKQLTPKQNKKLLEHHKVLDKRIHVM